MQLHGSANVVHLSAGFVGGIWNSEMPALGRSDVADPDDPGDYTPGGGERDVEGGPNEMTPLMKQNRKYKMSHKKD